MKASVPGSPIWKFALACSPEKANDAQDESSKLRGALEALQTQLVKVESGEKAAREALLRAELFGKGQIAEIGRWLAGASPGVQQAFF
ncbi:hypothetical protein ACFS07_33310 [Undibacterium arcticum]